MSRPLALQSNPIVTDNKMSPRYRIGETIELDPAKAIVPGCHVFVDDGTRTFPAKMVSKWDGTVVLQQINPPKEFALRIDQIRSIQRIVGCSEWD